MAFFPSPKLPSCCPQPRTVTMYFFCNNAWPVLQASALAGTHTATVKGWQVCMWLHFLWIRALRGSVALITYKIKLTHEHWEPVLLQVYSLTYPCPSPSAASQPVVHLRSSFCTLSVPSYDCQSHWHVWGPVPGLHTHLSHTLTLWGQECARPHMDKHKNTHVHIHMKGILCETKKSSMCAKNISGHSSMLVYSFQKEETKWEKHQKYVFQGAMALI